ncbi:MAG: signal peptidase II [Lachnospiraceae bacterium]|nr:signal peptidase II [Lachnospiraceae bacterium]
MTATVQKPNANEPKPIRKLFYAWIPVLIVILDRATKYWAEHWLQKQPNMKIPVIGDYVTFTYLENRGAAWGVMQGKVNFFVILTAVLIVLFLLLVARTPSDRRYLPLLITFLMLIGGAFGNLYDRIFQKHVTDFISFDVIHFPVFNVADIFVTVSFILLMILLMFRYSEKELSFIPLFGSDKKK